MRIRRIARRGSERFFLLVRKEVVVSVRIERVGEHLPHFRFPRDRQIERLQDLGAIRYAIGIAVWVVGISAVLLRSAAVDVVAREEAVESFELGELSGRQLIVVTE